MNGEMCKCGRPRSTAEDLAKWNLELEQHRESGGDDKTFNPEWAKAMCWTKAEYADRCGMKPLGPPEPKDTCGATCTCGRLKYTREDLNRWNQEICDAMGTRENFHPEWARGICWTDPKHLCQMKLLSKETEL
jgi:hypothetical protein